MKKVYLIVGVPSSGKSWVCDQIKDRFEYVHHDGYIGHINQPESYVSAIMKASVGASRPILAEAPFSISKIKDPLEKIGFEVTPVYIQEKPEVLRERYFQREHKDRAAAEKHFSGHLTRQNTFAQRAEDSDSFAGTSSEVLEHLKSVLDSDGPTPLGPSAQGPNAVPINSPGDIA